MIAPRGAPTRGGAPSLSVLVAGKCPPPRGGVGHRRPPLIAETWNVTAHFVEAAAEGGGQVGIRPGGVAFLQGTFGAFQGMFGAFGEHSALFGERSAHF